MPTISACVIAKNEQACIARCLQSVKESTDEIILVDTGSSDQTIEIAQALGAKIYHFDWNDDFAAARNYALNQAIGDWIVFLDADEYVVTDKAKNLRPLIEKIHGNRKIEAVCFLMEHTDGLDAPVVAQTQSLRLFRHSRAILYHGRIHEAILKNGKPPKALFAPSSSIVLRHTGYKESNLSDKAQRNLEILQKILADGTANCLTYYYFSQSYIVLKNYDLAIEFAQKALEDASFFISMVAYKPYVYIIKSMLQLKTYKQSDILPVVTEAMRRYPHHPEILQCAGHYQHIQGQNSAALQLLLQSLTAHEHYHDKLENEFHKSIALVHEEIATIYEMMNNSIEALKHSVSALNLQKTLDSAFDRLIFLTQQQRPAEIVPLLNSIYNIHDNADMDYVVRRLALLNSKHLYAHYVKMLSPSSPSKFQHFFTGMKAFLCNNYEFSLQNFALQFRRNSDYGAELMAIVSILLGEKSQWLHRIDNKRTLALYKVIAAFFNSDDAVNFSEEDFPHYSNIVLNYIHHSKEPQLSKLLHLAAKFPQPDALVKIIDLLINQHLYRAAFKLSTEQIAQLPADSTIADKIYFKAGLCCYKMKKYPLSVDLFVKSAMMDQESVPAVSHFLIWTHEQCNDSALRERIEALQTRYQLKLSEGI